MIYHSVPPRAFHCIKLYIKMPFKGVFTCVSIIALFYSFLSKKLQLKPVVHMTGYPVLIQVEFSAHHWGGWGVGGGAGVGPKMFPH